MRMIYMIATDVLRALGWEVEINERENYWNLVLTNTNSSEDMLQLSQGNDTTHRMRDFYGGAIIKFIDSARQKLAVRPYDDIPF